MFNELLCLRQALPFMKSRIHVHLFQVAERKPSVARRVANLYLRNNELNVHAGNGNNRNDSEFVDVRVPVCPPFF
jgi:hypothetical protein